MAEVDNAFDPFKPEDALRLRYEAAGDILTSLVGEIHPRLKFPDQRYTHGDYIAAQLTYEAITRLAPNGNSPDLPDGAIRSIDHLATLIVVERHLADISRFLLNGYIREKDFAYNGLPFGELPEVHPRVEGYAWFRGYNVPVGESGAVIVLDPWMTPFKEGGSPIPVLYTMGNPTATQVQEVAAAYAAELPFY